jgi:uroporphyrinogen decarboxylase
MLDRIVEFGLAIIEQAFDYDIDGVFFGDDWGQQRGLIMGLDLWRRYIKPRMNALSEKCQSKGLAVFLHCCGDVEVLFPELIEIGIDVFNPFQPEVMDIVKMKRMYGRDLSFFGGISIQRTMPFGTPIEVKEAAISAMRKIGRGGGYILAPSHSLPADVPLANMLALLEVVQNQ